MRKPYRDSVFERDSLEGILGADGVLHQAVGARRVLGRAAVLLEGAPGVPDAPALLHLPGAVSLHR